MGGVGVGVGVGSMKNPFPGQQPRIGNDILDVGCRKPMHKLRRFTASIDGDSTMNDDHGEQYKQQRFVVPNVPDPARLCREQYASVCGRGDSHQSLKFKKGTTTLSFLFKHGIIVSVDSRASQGDYVSSQSVHKVIPANPYLLGTMAGGAADCLFWIKQLGVQCRLYELRNGRRISVAAASKLFSNTMRSYRGYGLSIGSMVTGWDERGPQLFYIDNEGTRLRGAYFSQGSGSTFAYGVLDNYWKYDMSVEEAIALGRRCIYHATHRDGASGGVNNLYHVTPDGWKFMGAVDVTEMHYKHQEEAAAVAAAAAANNAQDMES